MQRERADRAIAQLATTQHGVVSRAQLLALGVGHGAIDDRIRRGALHRLHRGVYAVGHGAVGLHGRRIGAVLALGGAGLLSHRPAGDEWALRRSRGARHEVTVPPDAGRRPRAGFIVHRMATEPFERTVLDGLPITTPARTLVDLAEVLPIREVERAISAAEGLRLFDLTAVHRVISAHPGRLGARRLRTLLRAWEPPELTRSELEERVLALCARHDVPRPLVNARVAGLEVDFLWPEAGLVVEADGERYHHTRAAFERDRRRDALLLLHGLRVLRLTHRRIVFEADDAGRTLRALTVGSARSRRMATRTRRPVAP